MGCESLRIWSFSQTKILGRKVKEDPLETKKSKAGLKWTQARFQIVLGAPEGERSKMPDIKHSIQIEAPRQLVHPLVASAKGFLQWWAADVTEDRASGNVELGFFNRATVYGLHPVQITAPHQAYWLCQTGKEWSDTRLLFDLTELKGKT